MAAYKFREGYSVKGNVQAIGERLDYLMEKNNGGITPEQVLSDAKSKKSPLHDAFEWDDSAAAHAHRLAQARYLVRAIEVVHVPWGQPGDRPVKTIATRAFPHVTVDKQPVYATIGTVMASEKLREQLLNDARSALETWRKNYAGLKELASVYEAIDEVLAKQPVRSVRHKTARSA